MGDGGQQESHGGVLALIGAYLYESEAGMVIDGYMGKFAARAPVAAPARDAASRTMEAVEFFGVQMKQVSGCLVLIADRGGGGWLKRLDS